MNQAKLVNMFNKIEEKQLFWLLLIILVILVLHGKPVPFDSEFVYLIKLRPDFLLNDWTLSQPANEHWLFNKIFGAFAHIFSIEMIGWVGRLFVWFVCTIALIRIGLEWQLKNWQIAVSIIIWLCQKQGYVVIEWIFGGFEAKGIAFCFLLFSLLGFAARSYILPSIFLGLSFSFHPAVGLWGGLAIGASLLLLRTSLADLLKCAALVLIFASPALLVILFNRNDLAPTDPQDWEFIVKSVSPFHLNAAEFNNRDIFWLFAMLAFNIITTVRSQLHSLRFLAYFQIALAIFFLSGIILRWAEAYNLLGLMPMRLMPLFVPLFFLYSAFHLMMQTENRSRLIAGVAIAAFILGVKDPTLLSLPTAKETINVWRSAPDDLDQTYAWVSENTPKDSLIISPPIKRSVWYLSERATIAAFRYPTYEKLSEWRTRINDLTDNQVIPPDDAEMVVERAFNGLSESKIIDLKRKYNADFLISNANYSFPVSFQTQTYKVYDLRDLN